MKQETPHKIALNAKETLEAKELLRQRHLPDGTVENLVRWCLYGPEKKSSASENTSSSNSLNDDSKAGKDVFLWMTNHELMVCSPHLYNTEVAALEQGVSTSSETGGKDEESNDGSSDVEDLDDMRLDVIKLVTRARKQMHRMKKEGSVKPLVSLSHTTKVLSTYAGLGSLANVFRETGALDLILELLWTNDVDTRRAAGRMLRALALHDAGSRAYVLLSLTQDQQDEKRSEQKQHYADFENRAMVMEMFAETASGEEAHAVALDSVQLPQVPGKALFTLMKCYLRVTSLMDGNDKGENRRNQQKLLWMHTDCDSTPADQTIIEEFEVAFAIADLIFELNNVMDWNNKSLKVVQGLAGKTSSTKSSEKSVSPPPTPTLFGARLKQMVKAIRKSKTSELPQKPTKFAPNVPIKTEGIVGKPLFLQSSRESPIDPLLLSSLLKAGEPSNSSYKHPSHFSNRRQYAEYVRSEIRAGFRVRACQSYQDVNEGDEGVYRQHNHSTPPVQVFWHRLNRTYWVYWHHIVLLGEGSPDDETQPKPHFSQSPESSSLWPLLNGMQDRVKTLYGVRSSNERLNNGTEKKETLISQRDWWVIIFYVCRISAERREVIKQFLLKQYSKVSHICCIQPSREDALYLMSEILKDVSISEKEGICTSSICRDLIGEIEKAEKEKQQSENLLSEETVKVEKEQSDETLNDVPSTSEVTRPSTSTITVVKSRKLTEDNTKSELSLEEKAKAVEMGLRLELIVDEESEKRYTDIFLDKATYDLASRLWKLRQESKNLLKISKYIPKSGRGGKVVALSCMSALVKSEENESFVKRKDLDDIFTNAHSAAEDSDSSVVSSYLQFLLQCLQKRWDGEDELEIHIKLALSGHLKTVFDLVVRFQDDALIEHDAILCSSLISRAVEFSKDPASSKSSTFLNVITMIITSIFSAPEHSVFSEETTSSEKAKSVPILHAYLAVANKLIEEHNEQKDTSITSNKRSHVLYNALCVLCMVISKDQNKSFLSESDFALQVAETGIACTSLSPKSRRMILRLKGLTTSLSSNETSLDLATTAEHLLMEKIVDDAISEDDPPVEIDNVLIDIEGDSNEKITEFTSKLKSQSLEEARATAGTVINDMTLSVLKKSTSLSTESGKAVSDLKKFLLEFEGVAREGNLILFEAHWPILVINLHSCLEQCVSTSNKSLSVEVASDVVSVLQSLSSLDKDFAVLLCGLEAKQTILRLQEKHDSAPDMNKAAGDLSETISSCERQRNLHNRLLAVVLGGCISTALHCIEEARRAQKPINIPLFDQLLSNLCKGADLELKEDKCYEKLEVSSNPRQLSRLTDGNPKSYWESNGSSGAHWINVYMKKGIIVRKLTIMVAQEDSSYMPSRVVVFGGTTSADVTTQLSCVNVGSTDREVVILENARRYWPIVRISIRRCQQGGIDTRIHGIEVVGPKPSFWPLLRRQLYIRTSLIYSVQVHSWVADASGVDKLSLNQVMKHKILEVPNRLIKAIEFEQHFADEHLPNPESALVLGQACRSAFSNPILHDLLSKPNLEIKCDSLLELMLDAYVTCNERDHQDTDSLVFSSKLRRLLRLAVDLDQGGRKRSQSASGSSSSTKQQKEEHGIVAFGKRVQPFSKRWGGMEVKIARADSSTSLATAASPKQSSDDTSAPSGDDFYEPLSYLPQMAEQWASTIQRRFAVHLEASVATFEPATFLPDCISITENIFSKYNSFKKWTEDLFGTRSLFSLTLSVGVWKSISSLTYEAKRKLCCVFNVILHHFIVNESKGSDPSTLSHLRATYEQLRTFLLLTVGTNFCDVFEELYVVLQLARLTTSGGYYLEAEERVCTALQSCFPSRQPVSLIQDVKYSSGLNNRFLSSYLEQCDSLTSCTSTPEEALRTMWANYDALNRGAFNVLLLRPGACGKHVGVTTNDLSSYKLVNSRTGLLMKEFEMFFEIERNNHAARMFSAGKSALTWGSDVGYAVLHDTVNNIDITAKISDCLFLLQFNQKSEVAVEESTVSLQTLLEKKVICTSAPNVYKPCDVIESDVNCFISDQELCSTIWRVSSQLKDSFDKTVARVDCVIMKIIKHEKQLSIDALIEKTIRSCADDAESSNRIICSANLVRARCDHHIYMGYIVRKENSQQLVFNPDTDFVEKESKDCDVPDVSGMPLKSSNEKTFVKEFIKNVAAKDQSTPVAVDSQKARENNFTDSFIRAVQGDNSVFSKDVSLSFPTFSPLCGDNLSFTINLSPTTLESKTLLEEIRKNISNIAEVLCVEVDTVEALLLEFEWNSDKLIESFVTDREKTLKLVGILSVNSSEEISDDIDESCPICLNPITSLISVTLPCKHVSCYDCWKAYLSTKLQQDTACSTTCPIGSCQTRITSKIYHSMFTDNPELAKKYDVSLVRSFVEADRSYSWCHNPKGCDKIIRKSKDGRDEGWCSECGWQTCFTCTYVEAHYPASCSHMSQWIDDGGYYEGMSEDAQSKHLARLIAKRCPNCQAHIEKNDGCLHMKCIKCGHDFCWRCLQPWRPTHRDYYNCSSKVSKLAQSNSKFIEFNKRCQHHNMAKLFAYSIRDRLLALSNVGNLEHLKFSVDLCGKLAHYRRILAYCNVFNFYSVDTDRLNNIGLHSVALEEKALLLQEFMKEVLLSNADIQHTLSTISDEAIARGRVMIAECDAAVKIIVEFSKQGMKIAAPSGKKQLTATDEGTLLLLGDEEGPVVLNARPAGMSDDNAEDNMSGHTRSNNNQSDDDDDSDDDMNMYSSDDDDDDDDDNDLHYDSAGGVLMDYDSDDDDNMMPHSDSDDFAMFG